MTLAELRAIYLIFLAGTAITSVGLATFMLVRRKNVPAARPTAICILAGGLWSAGYAMELSSTTVGAALFWEKFEIIGIAGVTSMWLVATLMYTGKKRWLTPKNILLISLAPTAFILLGLTNEAHGLVYGPATMLQAPDGSMQLIFHESIGPAMYGYGAYTYAVFCIVLVVYVRLMVRSNSTYAPQITLNLLAALMPIAASVYDILRLGPEYDFELTPAAFALTALALGWSIIRAGGFDFLPLARGVIIESIQDAVYVLDAQQRIVDLNEVAARMIGQKPQQVIGTEFQEVTPDWMHSVADQPSQDGVWVEVENTHGDEEHFFEAKSSPLVPGGGAVVGRVLVLHDVTKRKLAENRLAHQALYDSLTGLPNRSLLSDRLETAIARVHRYPNKTFAVLFLDLDRFKVINDSMGHSAGDRVLIEVASRLRECVRAGDSVARLGGDEFVILLEEIEGLSEALVSAERVLDILKKPVTVSQGQVYTTCSIGVAVGSATYEDPEALLRDADTAMYRAKENGAGSISVFNRFMHSHAVARMRIETDLRRAIEQECQEFFLVFQPIFHLASGERIGLEALLRWQHPDRGVIKPQHFLSAAEETGLILPLGEWVLRQACFELQGLLDQAPTTAGDLAITVNISRAQLWQPDFPAMVQAILEQSGLDPSRLTLEITEGTFMKDVDLARQVFDKLKALGVMIDIDDFGTGYSSLSVLHHLPIDRVKVDRSFIAKIGEQDDDSRMVEAVLGLAQTLEIDTVAGGIEQTRQLERLKELNCTFGQGNLLAAPLRSEAVVRLFNGSSPRSQLRKSATTNSA